MKPGGHQIYIDEEIGFEEAKRHVSDMHCFVDITLLVEDDKRG